MTLWKPEYEGEYPTLGWAILDWVEEYLRIPDGDLAGQPFVFTDSQAEFFLKLFRVQETFGKALHYRRAARIGSKGTGKSPTGAVLGFVFIGAPVVPDGFDANGRPVGRPRSSPYVQIAGQAEAQAGNVYELMAQMVGEGGPLFDAIPRLDMGATRINIGSETVCEPVSSSAGTREGQRVTGAVCEETQGWMQSNGGIRLYGTLKRNVGKMDGLLVEMSNAPEPGLGSVAERTISGVKKGLDKDVLLDMKQPSKAWDWTIPAERRAHLLEVYGDTVREDPPPADRINGWVNISRIEAEIDDSTVDSSEALRFYGNVMAAGQGAWLDTKQQLRVKELIRPGATIPAKAMVCLGFDGSRTGDSTALRAIEVHSGLIATIGLWERPRDLQPGQYWEVPVQQVKEAFRGAMNAYRVVRAYCDPPYWRDEVTQWMGEWPEQVFEWNTNRDAAAAAMLERHHTAVLQGTVSFADDGHDLHFGNAPDSAAMIHYGNAYKNVKGSADKPLVLIKKESPESSRKIDVIMADALAGEARADAIEAGLPDDVPEDFYAVYDYS